MKKLNLSKDKGFTTADLIIAIIIVLFISIITTSFYNYYISVEAKNRRSIATNCIITVLENIEVMNYTEVTQEEINDLVNRLKQDGSIPASNYKITAELKKYNEIEGNEDKEDLIKIIKGRISYMVNNKEEKIEIRTLITK